MELEWIIKTLKVESELKLLKKIIFHINKKLMKELSSYVKHCDKLYITILTRINFNKSNNMIFFFVFFGKNFSSFFFM